MGVNVTLHTKRTVVGVLLMAVISTFILAYVGLEFMHAAQVLGVLPALGGLGALVLVVAAMIWLMVTANDDRE